MLFWIANMIAERSFLVIPYFSVVLSAAAKRSPNATYEAVGRPRYYQILVQLATQEFLLPKSMSNRPRQWSHVGRVVTVASCVFVGHQFSWAAFLAPFLAHEAKSRSWRMFINFSHVLLVVWSGMRVDCDENNWKHFTWGYPKKIWK